MMKSVVLYFSKFGHTRQVAEAVGAGLAAAGEVRVLDCADVQAGDLQGIDLLVMGSPTHRMNLPEALKPFFDTLPRRVLKGAQVAAFDTSYKMKPFLMRMTAGKRVLGKLRKLGGKKLVAPETFFVMERKGPLYEGELARAEMWGKTLAAELG